MATYIKDLVEDNGDITRPVTEAGAVLLSGGGDLETALASKADQTTVDGKISVGDVQSTDIVANAVTTAKIASNAVTSSKIDWTTIGETVNGTTSASVPINYAWKYPDGRLICFQRYVWSGKSVKQSWGSCYTGIFMTPTNYAVPFTATPLASATPNVTAGGNVWVASNSENGYTSKTKPGAFQLVRPNSTSSSDGYLDIVAYGYWK